MTIAPSPSTNAISTLLLNGIVPMPVFGVQTIVKRPRAPLVWLSVVILGSLFALGWWVVNVYAPPPAAILIHEQQPTPPRLLKYDWAPDQFHEIYEGGVLTFRNGDWFRWTDVKAVIGVYINPGHRNLWFSCPPTKVVLPGGFFTVDYRACALPLPSDAKDALVGSLHIEAHEGQTHGMGFEPGFFIPLLPHDERK